MSGVFYAVNEGMGIAIPSCQCPNDWRLWRGISWGRQPSRRSGNYWGQSGQVNAYVRRVHERGVRLVTQVNSVEDGLRAEEAGVDAVTVQGSEAGGHTGWMSMLPLLQGLVGQVRVPVIAAGGLGTAQGVAAALMGGADGVWLGTQNRRWRGSWRSRSYYIACDKMHNDA